MRAGIALLVIAYVFSQFFRAFLAVLTPVLETDLGAQPDDLALASGIWFLTFAVMQIPVGEALDRVGPRWTTALMFGLGGAGGTIAFALAQTPFHVTLAMGLLGIGCAPVLMAAYYIFAREFPVRVFATLAGATIGLGGFGNILGSAPMAWAVETYGWRETMWAIAVLVLLTAALIVVFVRDPAPVEGSAKGSVFDVMRIPQIWPVLIVMFAAYPPAASLRGLWAGPYLGEVFGADAGIIGTVTLVMALTMVLGNFVYGPLDRVFGTRKWVIIGGNLLMLAALLILTVWPAPGIVVSALLLAIIGLAGTSFAVVVAHGRAFLPAHLTGRGVTLINLFGIGAAGLMQIVTGPIWRAADARTDAVTAPYAVLFGFFAVILAIGLLVYLRAEDRTD